MKLNKPQPLGFQDQTIPDGARLAGAAALVHEFAIAAPVRRPGCVADQHVAGSRRQEGGWTIYDKRYWPGDDLAGHLEFFLKHEDADFLILRRVFEAVPQAEIEGIVRAAPAALHVRRAWFLYETLTGRTLDVEDAPVVAAADLLDPKAYFTGKPRLSRRHRVRDNLLGAGRYCPIIRRTETLERYLALDLAARARHSRPHRRASRGACRQLPALGRQPRQLPNRRRAPSAQPPRTMGPRCAAGRQEQTDPR